MSLMLTGVSRSGASLQAAYTDFVDTVTHTGRPA